MPDFFQLDYTNTTWFEVFSSELFRIFLTSLQKTHISLIDRDIISF